MYTIHSRCIKFKSPQNPMFEMLETGTRRRTNSEPPLFLPARWANSGSPLNYFPSKATCKESIKTANRSGLKQ